VTESSISTDSIKPKPSIREATDAERPLVVDITLQAYAEYEKHSDPAFWQRYQSNIREALLYGDSTSRYIAEIDGQMAASVLYCPPSERRMGTTTIKNDYPEMRLLATLKQFRGQGTGAALISFCEEKAKLAGAEAITLHTTILMQTAKAMYERRGYVRYPLIDFEPVPSFVVLGYCKHFDQKNV
jgi:GNAT superfamily N-acetyltransferase